MSSFAQESAADIALKFCNWLQTGSNINEKKSKKGTYFLNFVNNPFPKA